MPILWERSVHSVSRMFSYFYVNLQLYLLSILVSGQDLVLITKTRPCNIQRFFMPVKMTIFFFLCYYFLIFAQNIDCGYMLEPP